MNNELSIHIVRDKHTWEAFVQAQREHTFLHSWQWGEFNERMGDRVWRIGVYDGQELQAVALAILVHAKRGKFLFVPHGPISAEGLTLRRGSDPPALPFSLFFEALIQKLKEIALEERAIFIRISPLLENIQENGELFQKLGFRPAPIHMHAETTWTLDITPSEEELLRGMRKTTRNLIRRAEKEGVKITIGTTSDDIKRFYKLHEETVAKHDFTPFSRRYIEGEVETFAKDDNAVVILSWYGGEPQAGAVIIFYGDSAFYHHGASSLKYANIPSAYAVQWAAIKEAKKRGKKLYNFWGITASDNPKHPWAGLTLFKKGFGGYQTDYLHAQDLPTHWRYWPNWAIETFRRKKRGL